MRPLTALTFCAADIVFVCVCVCALSNSRRRCSILCFVFSLHFCLYSHSHSCSSLHNPSNLLSSAAHSGSVSLSVSLLLFVLTLRVNHHYAFFSPIPSAAELYKNIMCVLPVMGKSQLRAMKMFVVSAFWMDLMERTCSGVTGATAQSCSVLSLCLSQCKSCRLDYTASCGPVREHGEHGGAPLLQPAAHSFTQCVHCTLVLLLHSAAQALCIDFIWRERERGRGRGRVWA